MRLCCDGRERPHRSARRARRAHRDPVRQRRPGASRGRAPRPPAWVRDRVRGAGRHRRARAAGRAAARGRRGAGLDRPRPRTDRPPLRALRRPAARSARRLGHRRRSSSHERDGWLYAPRHRRRQGPALHAAEGGRAARCRRATLPVNVRFACDGEEEVGGHSIVDWLAGTRTHRSTRRSSSTAAWSSATCRRSTSRCAGLVYFHVTVRTGQRDLHSGDLRRCLAERDARARPGARGRDAA